uniref:Putative LOV domain-containing protein n=1 Tax=Mougeotia sp. BC-2016 TaxID=1799600 RepID=A0A140F7P3_9VIRI|nr:putative LOV domain-containing protein [Mougeotia sp. BC-2016]
MTEYSREEVIGKNCRFLQGPGTDRRMVLEIREAIREEKACHVKILNYTKSGKSFWNLFHLTPIFSQETGQVVYFIGVQTPIYSAIPPKLAFSDEAIVVHGLEPDHEMSPTDSHSVEGRVFADKTSEERANKAVDSVVQNLVESAKDKLSLGRSMDLESSSSAGHVCSSLLIPLVKIQQSFVLADPHLPDMPIVHASDVFCQLSGYSREEVVGRNCRFLQGPGTDTEAVNKIREAVNAEQSCTVRLLNYKKDGTPFWNSLHIAPVRNCQGKVAFYCGVQLDVSLADKVDPLAGRMKQLGTIGAVKVAVRALHGKGLRRTLSLSKH